MVSQVERVVLGDGCDRMFSWCGFLVDGSTVQRSEHWPCCGIGPAEEQLDLLLRLKSQ